jgi:serine/threonine-protein kinase
VAESPLPVNQEMLRPHILVVEDEDAIRVLVERVLCCEGYAVDTAGDGLSAHACLQQRRYDLVLLDVHLPGMSGIQLFEYCRRTNPGAEVLIMTADPDVDDAVNTLKQGAFDYLVKPLPMETLRQRVREALAAGLVRSAREFPLPPALNRTRVRDFRVIRALGAGAVGELFLVEKDGALYALKTLKQKIGKLLDPEALERFQREGRIIAGLKHPNIVRVFELNFGTGSRTPYMLMEYVDGESLHVLIQRNSLTLPDKIRILGEISAALGAVHAQAILHRDIKPGNVIIAAADRSARITDFGIAHLQDSTLTLPDQILGTPAYLAPECLLPGGRADERSDLFSLGVLSYELLSGSLPFTGPAVIDVVRAILGGQYTPLRQVAPGIPVALAMIIERLLARDPARRYATAAAVHQELGTCRVSP